MQDADIEALITCVRSCSLSWVELSHKHQTVKHKYRHLQGNRR